MSKESNTDFNVVYTTHNTVEKDEVLSSQQKLKVYINTRKGKPSTYIEGFIGSEDSIKALGTILKQQLGTGGTVKKRTLIIQGDFRKKVEQILHQKGYNL